MDKITIPLDKFQKFWKDYYSAKYAPQRFGQAFYNVFLQNDTKLSVEMSELFELDNDAARNYILDRFELVKET